jgi:chromosome segregation ATPase
MTPNDVTTILERLGRIEAKLDTHGDALAEIRKEVRKTNGRVTELEVKEREDRARIEGRDDAEAAKERRADRWVRPVIIGITIAVVGGAIGAAIVAGLNLNAL